MTIRARQVNSWIEIEVSDTGIGIAKSDLGRLFTEFQQLDAGPGREQEGTGLGLALTKRFAELHGGHVSVESVPGKGSTFVLSLPAVAKPASSAGKPRSAAAGAVGGISATATTFAIAATSATANPAAQTHQRPMGSDASIVHRRKLFNRDLRP